VTSERGVPGGRPPRPIPYPAADALLSRSEDLAKNWLLTLLEQRELEDAPAILAADLVREGPRLCDAVVRALADDRDLRRLEPGGPLERLASRAGALAGASQPEPVARAVDALRMAIWTAFESELERPDPAAVEALGERLTHVTEIVRAAVLRRFDGTEPAADVEDSAAGRNDRSAAGVDRAAGVGATPTADRAGPAAPDSLWRGALEDEVREAQRSGAHLALLLAELSDADGVPVKEPAHVASETFGRFAQAVRSTLRREDILACETESRAWVIARTTGRSGARALGSRIAHAVQDAEPRSRAPVTIGIGIAVLGEDGRDATGLIDAAGEWTLTAVSPTAAVEAPSGLGGSGGVHGPRGPRLVS